MVFKTLKKRREFLRVRGGRRWATPAFVLEGKARPEFPTPQTRGQPTVPQASGAPQETSRLDPAASKPSITESSVSKSSVKTLPPAEVTPKAAPISAQARFGFTITKKIGGAVDRNRIRRRLKAALQEASTSLSDPQFDYIVLARRAALDRPYDKLLTDIATALRHIHSSNQEKRRHSRR